jgi:hypothetical protein
MKRLRGQRGQATLEVVLVFGVVATLWLGVLNGLKSRDFFGKTFGEPWGRLKNTIEFGVPSVNTRDAGTKHPTGFFRHATRRPEP